MHERLQSHNLRMNNVFRAQANKEHCDSYQCQIPFKPVHLHFFGLRAKPTSPAQWYTFSTKDLNMLSSCIVWQTSNLILPCSCPCPPSFRRSRGKEALAEDWDREWFSNSFFKEYRLSEIDFLFAWGVFFTGNYG